MLEPNPECREHFPKRVQECKDCEGLGEWACYGKAYFCKTCDGTGEIDRTGPYRLADGTWSDGVDRTRRLSSSEFGEENPQRLGIFRPSFIDEEWIARGDVWAIVRGIKSVEWFATHAEAIAYANKLACMARTNQGENNE